MSNQMTTPISSIPVTNNVKPNDDMSDPIVQEILGNMANSVPVPVQVPEKQISFNTQQPIYNYPVQNEKESFLNSFYDKKIMILTFIMLIVFIVINSNQIEDIFNNINVSYVQEYKIQIKYILLYFILYIIQKYGF